MKQVYGHDVDEVISSLDALRTLFNPPGVRAANKVTD